MPAQAWEKTLRKQIKHNHGFGWNVIGQSGKTKLTRVFEDGAKSPKLLPIEWKATNSVQILNAVTRVHELVESRNISIAEAVRLDTEALAVPEEHNGTADQGWPAVVEEYLATKQGRRSSTLADFKTRLNRALACMESRPKPRDSRALLKRFAELHFSAMPSGGQASGGHLIGRSSKAERAGQYTAACGCLNSLWVLLVQPQLDRQFEAHFRGPFTHQAHRRY